MRKITSVMAAAGALALALTGCSSSGGSNDAAKDSGELTKVTVGVMPIVDTAAIYVGKEQGFFEEEGIDLNLEIAQGGAAIVPAVVSGDYQFGFSNVVSLYVAQSNGVPVKAVTPANATAGSEPDIGAVVVPGDSDIQSPKDLAGKTVAVNTLKNIGDTTISNVVEKDGGDPAAVKFTEMGFPDMPAAISSKQVDAAWILEPHLTRALNDGARVVSYNFFETDPNLLISSYFTSQPYADQHPEVVESFKKAMEKSLKFAEENPDVTRDVLDTYTEIDPAIKEKMTMPKFPSEFPRESMQKLADLSLKYGVIEKEADLDALLP